LSCLTGQIYVNNNDIVNINIKIFFNMVNNLAQNLQILREKKGLKQIELSELLNIKRSTLASYENGHSEPNIDRIIIIADFFGVDPGDLLYKDLTDVQVMEENGVYKKEILSQGNSQANGQGNDQKQGIPLIPVEAMAGMTNGDVQVTENDVLKRYIVPEFTELGVNFIIQAKGSSMQPKYNSGDLLACKKIKDITFFQWGKVYVLDTNQGALVKRLHPSKNEGLIECHSDNKEMYPPFEIQKTDIRSIAIVVGVIRLE
jgi:phage repressor protein C with HTH and peptisase S24 domain